MAQITGIVKLVSAPIEGVTVRLYYRDTGELYGETISSDDGTFIFSGIPDDTLFTAVAVSQDPYLNSGIADGILSVADNSGVVFLETFSGAGSIDGLEPTIAPPGGTWAEYPEGDVVGMMDGAYVVEASSQVSLQWFSENSTPGNFYAIEFKYKPPEL